MDYIATWFYAESAEEAGYYPQLGGRGSSPLVHSIYMQIQVPFFVTFRHYNPRAELLFFTNLEAEELPDYLLSTFGRLGVETLTVPYTNRPPEGWHGAWQNQFYLFDILSFLARRINDGDTVTVADADCVCRHPLDGLLACVRRDGSALYELFTDPERDINGITLSQMDTFYAACYGCSPCKPLSYYGGEFVSLRGDMVKAVSTLFPELWAMNVGRAEGGFPKLNEEAHCLSVIAERLGMRNATANGYVKRMWTSPIYNNVRPGDENLSVWHLPYEKKRGLHRLCRLMTHWLNCMDDEEAFWKMAGEETGIPVISRRKKWRDKLTVMRMKLLKR